MARLIITFETLHKVLAADKALRADPHHNFRCRTTPTPPGLSHSICGMSLELLEHEQASAIIQFLSDKNLAPEGVHELA
ncbi:MAG: DUF3343 domain-containing protein [Terriglobales bacterium]